MNLYKQSKIQSARSKIKSVLNHLIDAIRGVEYDYTKINITKAIFLLSIPMALEMLMESIFAIVDIFFVSKLGSDAVATVGLTESLLTLVYAVNIGLATAATAIISRRIGENNSTEAGNSAFQALLAGLIPSILISLIGIFFSKQIFAAMGASSYVINNSGYLQIVLGGNIVIMLLFMINAIFRSAGDAAIALRILVLSNTINIILDPLFIFGIGPFPHLGVTGAAVATTTGRGIGAIVQLYVLFFGNKKIQFNWKKLKIDFKIILKIYKLSLGSIGQHLIATSSWIALIRIISIYGSNVVAGYTIAIRIILFLLLPTVGMGNAASTLVGQNLGAGQPQRAESSVNLIGKINAVLLGTICIVFIVFSQFWISLFTSESQVIIKGAECLNIMSYGFIFYGLGIIFINGINGAGDTYTPIKLNLIFFWATEIPLAVVLAIVFNLKETGVFYAIVFSETALTLATIYLFRKGKWKTKVI